MELRYNLFLVDVGFVTIKMLEFLKKWNYAHGIMLWVRVRCSVFGRVYADSITKFTWLDGLPAFLTHGALLLHAIK